MTPKRHHPYDFSGCSVLVIEDSELMRDLLRNVLRAFKIRNIRSANDGHIGISELKAEPVDVILSDWLMKKMSGIELIEKIRWDFDDPVRRTPVVMCTAYTDVKRILKARDSGANEILTKPFTPARLYDALANAVFKPRDFIVERAFIGPDRRRRQIPIKFADRRRDAPGATFEID